MERIIVDSNEVTNYIKIMSKHLDAFIDTIDLMRGIKSTIEWDSNNKEKMFLYYDNIINSYISFIDKMIKYIEYLTTFLDNYDESTNEIKNHFQILKNEYDIEEL